MTLMRMTVLICMHYKSKLRNGGCSEVASPQCLYKARSSSATRPSLLVDSSVEWEESQHKGAVTLGRRL